LSSDILQRDLKRFEDTDLYRELVERTKKRRNEQVEKLIELASCSPDINLRSMATAIRSDLWFWKEIAKIKTHFNPDSDGKTHIPELEYEEYESGL